jgi:hypothetical protein
VSDQGERLREFLFLTGMDAPFLGSGPVISWVDGIHVPNLTDIEMNRLESALEQPLDDRGRTLVCGAVGSLITRTALICRFPRLKECRAHLEKIISAGNAFIRLCHPHHQVGAAGMVETYLSIASGGKLQACLDEVDATIKLADDTQREMKALASKRGDKGDIALAATLRSLVLAAEFAGADMSLPGKERFSNADASSPLLDFTRAALAIAVEKAKTALADDDERKTALIVLSGYRSITGRAIANKLSEAKASVRKEQALLREEAAQATALKTQKEADAKPKPGQ